MAVPVVPITSSKPEDVNGLRRTRVTKLDSSLCPMLRRSSDEETDSTRLLFKDREKSPRLLTSEEPFRIVDESDAPTT